MIGNGHAGFGRGDAGKGPHAPRQHPYLTRHPPRLTERQRENANAARAAGENELAPLVAARAWQAQVRLNHRHRVLTHDRGKRATVTNVAVARELVGFLWAAMTDQPLREESAAA